MCNFVNYSSFKAENIVPFLDLSDVKELKLSDWKGNKVWCEYVDNEFYKYTHPFSVDCAAMCECGECEACKCKQKFLQNYKIVGHTIQQRR